MWPCVWSCGRVCGNRLLNVTRHQNRRLCSRPHSRESVIFFFVFLAFIVLRYGHFVEYMNMHAKKLMQLGCGSGLDFAPMASQLK